MATKTIEFEFQISTTFTDVTSVVLRDPLNTFGIKRTDTGGILVASGTPLVHVTTGVYHYTFVEPASNLSYEYWLEYVYLGKTRRQRQILQGGTSGGVAGNVTIPPSAYVGMGVQMVSCGDATLEEFLNAHAATLWAMELRRGVVLDSLYLYFTRGLLDLALDHVRMLIDTEIAGQQTKETGLANSSLSNTTNSASSQYALSVSNQTATSTQNMMSSAVRFSSSETISDSSQASTRTNESTDESTQIQSVINRRTGSNDSIVKTSTLPSGAMSTGTEQMATSSQYRNSHSRSTSDMHVDEQMLRFAISIPFVGDISGQNGSIPGSIPGLAKSISPDDSNSETSVTAYDKQSSDQRRRRKVITTSSTGGSVGKVLDDSLTAGTGHRDNNIHRSSSSNMTGSSISTSVGSMTSASHDESHGKNESNGRSESIGHSTFSASSLAHRESQGSSQMQGESTLDRQYYDQIFESLQQMWKDTMEQIKAMEQQGNIGLRYLLQKMTKRTPQSSLVIAQNANVQQTPNGFLGGGSPFSPYTIR